MNTNLPVNKQIFNINWDVKSSYKETRTYKDSELLGENLGIIIDNGSYECRAGWSISQSPDIRFRSLVGKPKVPIKGQESIFLVGNEMLHIDPGKLNKKSPFEKNYITHFGTQEHILDHIFANLNIQNNSVDYPVLITEPLCNLNWSRKNLSEMMFELYSVPSLAYGVDMLFSLDYNLSLKDPNWNCFDSSLNCLIISSSYQTTHVVPILNGKIQMDKVRRIGIGAFHGNELLTKSLNLRFPDVRTKFTPDLISEVQENYTMCAIDYKSQLKLFQSLFEYDQIKLKEENNKRLYGSLEMYEKANFDEIAIKREQENKYKHLKKYRNKIDYENEKYDENEKNNLISDLVFFELPKLSNEMQMTEEELKKRQEVRKEQSRRLREIMQRKKEETIKALEKELSELEEISSLNNAEVDKYQLEEALLTKGFTSLEDLQKRVNKIYMKINFNREKSEEIERVDEEKRWPLLSVPDEDLTEEQIKMKKIHKMQRQAYLNRLDKREKLRKEKEKVEELKQKDPESYLVSLYRRKKELLDRLEKYKAARKDISNRSSKVNRGRMMVLVELGKESKETKKGENQMDDFGINDEDWEIYRGISKHNLSEDEEEDSQQLQEIEAQIIETDPNYFKYSDDIDENLFFSSKYLCLGVDQFRGAEILFQPHIIGHDQAGLIEIILSVLKTLSFKEQKEIAGNIFLTGGFANTPHLRERILKDLRENLHCDIDINITLAEDPLLDSWKGAKNFFNSGQYRNIFISRSEYLENGPEYFKEHFCSNTNLQNVVLNYNSYNEGGSKKQKTVSGI